MAFSGTRQNDIAPERHASSMPDDNAYKLTHPAFAQIRASRVSGNRTLYGSDFDHHNYIEITLKRSEWNRTLHHDWFFGRDELYTVALSEMQWANFVSAMNVGDGTPCTMVRDKDVGLYPGVLITDRTEQFADEVRDQTKDAITDLRELIDAIDASGLSKTKAEGLKAKAQKALRTFQDHLPWAEKQFRKHMENSVEKAKAEVAAYANAVIRGAGLTAIEQQRSGRMTIRLPGNTDADHDH